jgi:hypothetical protein
MWFVECSIYDWSPSVFLELAVIFGYSKPDRVTKRDGYTEISLDVIKKAGTVAKVN